jgi:hypothetical protein
MPKARIKVTNHTAGQEFRSHFGPKRRTAARKLRWLPFAELRTLRDLKKDVVS